MTEPRPSGETSREADRVEAAVSARISPTPEFLERVAQVRAELVRRVEAAAQGRTSPLVRALVAGSAARGTFLSDRLDIDLFLLFPPDLSRDRLREEGLALGAAVLSDTEKRYAEHPYLRGRFEGFAVDAVPGFAISDPSHPLSPVDRTPFHQAYLVARETPVHLREIRLAKQFFRRLGVYGSEARTEGVSGYLVELLILRFGSLRGLLSAARHWRVPVKLADPGHEPPRLPEEVALILADPVDPNRNVASALSRRNLGTLILAAGTYLDRPSEEWFEVRPRSRWSRTELERRLASRDSHVTVLSVPRPDLVDDTLYPQVRKAERAVARELGQSGFEVLSSAAGLDRERVHVLVEVAHRHRAAVRLQDGPPPGIDRAGDFLEKWTAPDAPVLQGPYVRDDGSLAVETLRAEREVEEVLRHAAARLSLGKDLTPSDPTRTEVRALAEVPDAPAVEEALRDLLAKQLPWAPRR
jgi:tRNA nucleotidyltransferase (CCA-adding enzyme)